MARAFFPVLLLLLSHKATSFVVQPLRSRHRVAPMPSTTVSDDPFYGLISFSNSIQRGDGVKQSLANALAGPAIANDEGATALLEESLALAKSAPIFMFTWSMSPACKSAVAALDRMGVKYEVKELDKPWEEGNPIRAVLGRHLGKSSVPMIFIGGKYIGGYSDGPVEGDGSAPGLVALAFDGALRPMLEEAGALPGTT